MQCRAAPGSRNSMVFLQISVPHRPGNTAFRSMVITFASDGLL
jgi:hypothetical protein